MHHAYIGLVFLSSMSSHPRSITTRVLINSTFLAAFLLQIMRSPWRSCRAPSRRWSPQKLRYYMHTCICLLISSLTQLLLFVFLSIHCVGLAYSNMHVPKSYKIYDVFKSYTDSHNFLPFYHRLNNPSKQAKKARKRTKQNH